jgi:hypothetical protein
MFIANSVSIKKSLIIIEDGNLGSDCTLIFRTKLLFNEWYSINKNRHDNQVLILEDGLLQLLFLPLIVLSAKLYRSNIYIFHECCWELLDINLSIFNPKILFWPTYKLEELFEITNKKFIDFDLKTKLICCIGFKKKFITYERVLDNGDIGFVSSLVEYKNYEVFEPNFTYEKKNGDIKSVIFLIGTSMIEKNESINIITSAIEVAKEQNCTVAIKDHPNPKFRLGTKVFEHLNIKIIEATKSTYNLPEHYGTAVSLDSTGVSDFNSSFILLPCSVQKNTTKLKKYIEYLKKNTFNSPIFIEQIDQFKEYLISQK